MICRSLCARRKRWARTTCAGSRRPRSLTARVRPPTIYVREALAYPPKDLPPIVRTPHAPVADDLRWEPALAIDTGDESSSWSPSRAVARNLLPMGMAADLASRSMARIERECSTFSAKSLRGVMVPAAVTDLALAANQSRFFERVIRAGRRYGLVGFETRNLGHLLL